MQQGEYMAGEEGKERERIGAVCGRVGQQRANREDSLRAATARPSYPQARRSFRCVRFERGEWATVYAHEQINPFSHGAFSLWLPR